MACKFHLRIVKRPSCLAFKRKSRVVSRASVADFSVLLAQIGHLCHEVGALFQSPVNDLFDRVLQIGGQGQFGKIHHVQGNRGRDADIFSKNHQGVALFGLNIFQIKCRCRRLLSRLRHIGRGGQTVFETLLHRLLDLQRRVERGLGHVNAPARFAIFIKGALYVENDLLMLRVETKIGRKQLIFRREHTGFALSEIEQHPFERCDRLGLFSSEIQVARRGGSFWHRNRLAGINCRSVQREDRKIFTLSEPDCRRRLLGLFPGNFRFGVGAFGKVNSPARS